MEIPSHYIGQEVKCVSCGYKFKAILATGAPIRATKPKSCGGLDSNNKSSSNKVLVIGLSIGCGLLATLFVLEFSHNQKLIIKNSNLQNSLEEKEKDFLKKNEAIKVINQDLVSSISIVENLKEEIHKLEQTISEINKEYINYREKSNSIIGEYAAQLKKTESLNSSLQSKIVAISEDKSQQEEQQRIENEQRQHALEIEKRRLALEQLNAYTNLSNSLNSSIKSHNEKYDHNGKRKINIDMPSDEEWELMHLREEVESLRQDFQNKQ
jgi:hypothetical protein